MAVRAQVVSQHMQAHLRPDVGQPLGEDVGVSHLVSDFSRDVLFFLVGYRDVVSHLGRFTRVSHFHEVGEALKLTGPGPLQLRFPA
ncbi:hypothetical protein D9M68_843590 [compost metagenome]